MCIEPPTIIYNNKTEQLQQAINNLQPKEQYTPIDTDEDKYPNTLSQPSVDLTQYNTLLQQPSPPWPIGTIFITEDNFNDDIILRDNIYLMKLNGHVYNNEDDIFFQVNQLGISSPPYTAPNGIEKVLKNTTKESPTKTSITVPYYQTLGYHDNSTIKKTFTTSEMSSLGNVFVNPNNPTVEKQVFTEYPSYVQNQDNYEFTNENVDSHSYTVESTYTEKLANNKWDENTTGQTYLSEPQDNPSITINLQDPSIEKIYLMVIGY